MKKQKILGLAVVLSGLFLASSGFAQTTKKKPGYGLATQHETMDFFGATACVIDNTATATLCYAGEGLLDAVCASDETGIAVGDYTVVKDSAVAAGNVVAIDTLAISPRVVASSTQTLAGLSPVGCWQPAHKARFNNGLVGVQNAAKHSSVIYYHKSDGSNP